MNVCDRVGRRAGEKDVFHILWLPRQARRWEEETVMLSLQGSEAQLALWSGSENNRMERERCFRFVARRRGGGAEMSEGPVSLLG